MERDIYPRISWTLEWVVLISKVQITVVAIDKTRTPTGNYEQQLPCQRHQKFSKNTMYNGAHRLAFNLATAKKSFVQFLTSLNNRGNTTHLASLGALEDIFYIGGRAYMIAPWVLSTCPLFTHIIGSSQGSAIGGLT